MEFQNENGTGAKNDAAKETSAKAQKSIEIKKPNGNSPQKENAAGNGNTEAGKEIPTTEVKPETAKAQEPVKEATQSEVKEPEKAVKPALNLEATLKAVDTLHRRSIQRLNLISRMKQLETFEVVLTQENDELEDNPYQGCKLIIEDDKKRQFITVQPGLIRMVAQFIFDACNEKLIEIEASLIFPNA